MTSFLRLTTLLIGMLLCVSGSVSYGQVSEIDSVKRQLARQPADTNRVVLLNQLGLLQYLVKPDTTYLLGQQAYQLARQLGYHRGESRGLAIMSIGLSRLGDYPKALRLNQQAIQISDRINDQNAISAIVNNNAEIYASQKDQERALKAYQQSLLIHEQANSDPARYDTAVYTIMYANIGETYLKLNRVDSADYYLNRAYRLAKAIDFRMILGQILYDMGDVEVSRKRPNLALTYYRQAMVYNRQTNSLTFLAETHLRMARFYQRANQLDSSLIYARNALVSSQNSQYLPGLLEASQLLSQVYDGRNDREALRYYKIAVAAKDSLFSQEKTKQFLSLSFEEQQRQQEIEAAKAEFKSQVRFYALLAVLIVFLGVAVFLVRNNRQKQRANELLSRQKAEIDFQRTKAEQALSDLQTTQAQLIQKEKMASLGELTAGIAHEIQNPLNFVNNFSEVSTELVGELTTELDRGDTDQAKAIAQDLIQNLHKINQHGNRAAAIVKGMLAHSRIATGTKQPTPFNALANEYLRLAYQGLRAKDQDFTAELITDFDPNVNTVEVVPQDIGRVLLNLYTNAFHAVQEKQKQVGKDGAPGSGYQPTIWVSTHRENGHLTTRVRDNGTGIAEEVRQKVFHPFFTTKPAGQGTGLGLSLAYDIITKGHRGSMTVASQPGEGAEFLITLPV